MIDSYEAWRRRMGYDDESSSGGELPDLIDDPDDWQMGGGLEGNAQNPSVIVYDEVSDMESEGDSSSSESDTNDWILRDDDGVDPSLLAPE
jgi:hypothetical protein